MRRPFNCRYTRQANPEGHLHCVIIVENLPVPPDRRVWQEAVTLKRNGWDVSIICPRTEDHPEEFLQLEGIDIYRHSLPSEGNGLIGYVIEYVAALFHECRLLAKIYKKTNRRDSNLQST